MNDQERVKAYANLRAKVGTYTDRDGNEKSRYVTVGKLFASEHFNSMFIALDAIPAGNEWNGRLYVNKIEEEPTTQSGVPSRNEINQMHKEIGGGVDLAEIPF